MFLARTSVTEMDFDDVESDTDAADDNPLLPKEKVSQLLEYVLPILVAGDVVVTNEEVEKHQFVELFVDVRGVGKLVLVCEES